MTRRSDHLDPGLYLVGREDGLVEPFHVWVHDDGAECREDVSDDLVTLAQTTRGWWWRLLEVPDGVPANWNAYPKPMPGGMDD